MNFQINILTEDEQSTEVHLTKKSFSKIALIIAPVIVALFIAMNILSSIREKSDYKKLERTNREHKRDKKQLQERAILSKKVQTYINEMAEWRDLHSELADWLPNLVRTVPETMQVRSLSIRCEKTKKAPGDAASLKTKVKLAFSASPEISENEIKGFVSNLSENERIDSADLSLYKEPKYEDGTPAPKTFSVDCNMHTSNI